MFRRIRRSILLIIPCFLVLLQSFLAPKTAEANDPIIFKLAFTDPPTVKVGNKELNHHTYAGMLAFKNSLEKLSDGRIKVELYTNGVLGDFKSNMEQILAGTLQGATPPDGGLAPFYKDIQVFSVPYLFNDPKQAYELLDGPFGQKLFNDMAQKSGFRVLSVFENGGFRNFSNNKRPIKTADDMQGLKIRTQDIPAHMEMVKALGASPTPVAWLELYGALQTGVVDGQENSAITTLGGSLHEVQKYYTLDGHILGFAFIVTSEKWLQSLPKDLQESVIKAGQEAAIAARETSQANESLALEALKNAGVEIYDPSPEELDTFKKVRDPVIQYLKQNITSSLVDEILAAVGDRSQSISVAASNGSATSNSPSSNMQQSGAANPSNDNSATSTVIYSILGALILVVLLYFFSRKRNRTDSGR